jgi:predicted nucleic acid-binding protein
MSKAASGQRRIVVSAGSLLEVTRERNKPVDLSKQARITSFFERSFVVVRDLDRVLARNAQGLIYDYLWHHPIDAAHLATAIDTGCQVFYTYDRELIDGFDNERGLRVLEPGIMA